VDPIHVQGRVVTEADLKLIGQLRREHPAWSRYRLSRHLAEQWRWYNGAGRLKDMAARTLLLKLQRRGLIELPAPRRPNSNRHRRARPPSLTQPALGPWPSEPIVGPLRGLQPLRVEWITELAERRRAAWLLEHYHYQGFAGAVGENVQYLVHDAQGREVAVMVFGAAAWKVADRDRFIGWSVAQRRQGLAGITNQQRFLILPWVQVAHLASHLLALALARLAGDWQHRYGHRVWLVETFVEAARFRGTAYQAAGWLPVGQTTGRSRQDRRRQLQVPIKRIWLKALHPHFRQYLCGL
jgi:hypothetical protein